MKKITEYRYEKHTSIPDIIIRNHNSMVAFRDIFDMYDDDIRADARASTKDDIQNYEEYETALNIGMY